MVDSNLQMLRENNIISLTKPLSELVSEPGRFKNFSRELNGVVLDFSRVRVDQSALSSLLELAETCGVDTRRRELFRGGHVNLTENRPALHMLLRGGCDDDVSAPPDAQRALQAIEEMLTWAAELHAGRLPGDTGTRIKDIVHIGIGGSLLGTRLLCEALGADSAQVPEVHFLGSVDAHYRVKLLSRLDPSSTLVVVVSKSFTTGDTLMHARALREWMSAHLTEREVRNRLFAISSATARVAEFGIDPSHVLYLPDWVGGRYSLWSPVSLSAAAQMGPTAFRELLRGAADMDRHFMEADAADNLPVLMGLIGVWHRNVCGFGAWGVFPYDQRLRLLPSHLQQLIMESNGKAVTLRGEQCQAGTSPVVFGESGTEAQHSVFQALHQGVDIVPVQFVGVIRPAHDDRDAHAELLANLLAQATALACGRSEQETLEQMLADGVTGAEALLPHRVFTGNRPSEIVLLDELTPANLGRLLALYEHKVFVESVAWDINAFDQWGVELGKQLAPAVQNGLLGGSCSTPGLSDLLGLIRDRS